MRSRASHLTLRTLEERTQALHQREFEGVTSGTPFIALAGVLLFLLPIVAVLLGSAEAVYYLS